MAGTDPAQDTPDADEVVRRLEARLGPGVLYPISYGAPAELIVNELPTKRERITGLMTKSNQSGGGYRFGAGEQDAYYDQYRSSYLAVTRKRGGWDCLRHIEIMQSGCLPWFEGLEQCPTWTLAHYPKSLLLEISRRYAPIAHAESKDDAPQIDPQQYERDVQAMLGHLREKQTTLAIAHDLLKRMNASDAKRVLFLTAVRKPNYSCDLLFHGLRSLLGEGCVDVRKRWWMYDSLPAERYSSLYGNGFTYAGHLPEIDIDRGGVNDAIRRRAYDLVVYGCVEYGTPHLHRVRRYYDRKRVALIDGGDLDTLPGTPGRVRTRRPPWQQWACGDAGLMRQGVYFKREIADHTLDTAERQADAAGLLR